MKRWPVVIYQGSHGDRGAHRADIFFRPLPAPESALFVNTEGLVHNWRWQTCPWRNPEKWAILRALFEMGKQDWDNLAGCISACRRASASSGPIDVVAQNDWKAVKAKTKLGKATFKTTVTDFT
jgi:NADH-quinone oxidoreductase subunit G